MPGERSPDLFDMAAARELSRRSPLASRLRPRTIDEVIGQRHLLAPGAPLRLLVERERLSSSIFFGPPGTGKTTVAMLIAELSGSYFERLSAVSAGVKEVREVLEGAHRRLGMEGISTILFLDEIHRFSRSQQDALLPGVEDGTIILIGATTENPYFALNAPLLSRMTLFRFEALSMDELEMVARRALSREQIEIDEDALRRCCNLADGDARNVLTTLEVAIALLASGDREVDGASAHIDLATIDLARTTRALRYGRDEHYDAISALIKSLRGSDPDAGIYWLARLLAMGEDPRFLARRLVILASEDIGNADPMALLIANGAAEALDRVGLPEAGLNLAQAVTYLALAPKSNATTVALAAATDDVRNGPPGEVPAMLRDGHYQGARDLGHGVGYVYPHDHPDGWVEATYLPEALVGRRYYHPSGRGYEAELMERLESLRTRDKHGTPRTGGDQENRVDTRDDDGEGTGG